MHNFKKLFTYMVVGALVMALSIISCSNEDTTGGGSDVVQGYTHSNHLQLGAMYLWVLMHRASCIRIQMKLQPLKL